MFLGFPGTIWGMATEGLDQAGRDALAAAVKTARLAAGMSVEAAAARASARQDRRMSPVTWGRVEAAENVQDATYYRVFETLGWDWTSFADVITGKPPRSLAEDNVPVVVDAAGQRQADHGQPASRLRLLIAAQRKLQSGEPLTSDEAAALRRALENSEIATLEDRLSQLSREDLLQVSRFVDELLAESGAGTPLLEGGPDGSPPDFDAVGPEDYDWGELAARRTTQTPDDERVQHIDPVADDGESGED